MVVTFSLDDCVLRKATASFIGPCRMSAGGGVGGSGSLPTKADTARIAGS